MTQRTAPFTIEQVGTGTARFPSAGAIPTATDAAVDPYVLTRMSKLPHVEALLFWPQAKGLYPGLVVLHEDWGLNMQIKELANRLACEGYAVIVPNLYTRQGGMVTANAEAASTLMARAKEADLLQDINQSCEYLNTRDYVKRNIHGVIGFGMGGTLAIKFMSQRKRLRTAVSFYGALRPPFDFLSNLHCPLLYHWAGADESVNAADIEQFRRTAQEQGKRVTIHKYDGAPPAFCNETHKETYRPDAAQTAWDRTMEFLEESFKADLQTPAK
ncbi:MAG: dienelactone hydrolase family protein [Nitrospiraceae bacterium]|nr:dienelactone hydrolase family protein [Nitrospiraceae bacterium]MSR23654.1 dienelactone hydrolase family protein [Nitrospiraceae bacterium]